MAMSEDIYFETTIYIKAPKERVWEYIVKPDYVSKYYLCPLLKIGDKAGDLIEYGMKDKILISGKITAFKPGSELSHSFVFDPTSHAGTELDGSTLVNYRLNETDGITELVLHHGGFKSKDQTFSNITGGWPWIISNLKTYIETGKPLN